jgi:acetyltransferase
VSDVTQPQDGSERPVARVDFEHLSRTDQDRDIAFVAVRQARTGTEEILGEVGLHRYPGTPTAELAIMVRSDMQRRGLGRALMRKAGDYCAAHGLDGD